MHFYSPLPQSLVKWSITFTLVAYLGSLYWFTYKCMCSRVAAKKILCQWRFSLCDWIHVLAIKHPSSALNCTHLNYMYSSQSNYRGTCTLYSTTYPTVILLLVIRVLHSLELEQYNVFVRHTMLKYKFVLQHYYLILLLYRSTRNHQFQWWSSCCWRWP